MDNGESTFYALARRAPFCGRLPAYRQFFRLYSGIPNAFCDMGRLIPAHFFGQTLNLRLSDQLISLFV